jgi:hypothetical protein
MVPAGAGQDREQDLVQQTGDGATSGRFADLGDAGWPAPPEPLPDASCLQGRKPSGRQAGLYREPGRRPRAERLGRAIRRVAVTESSP